MSKSKHTPGPWYAVGRWVEHENEKIADICNCDPESMGQGHLNRSDDEIRANARLIAAAPDMLNALEMLARVYDDPYDLVKTAIAQAKGE